jgi:hypothetical protein
VNAALPSKRKWSRTAKRPFFYLVVVVVVVVRLVAQVVKKFSWEIDRPFWLIPIARGNATHLLVLKSQQIAASWQRTKLACTCQCLNQALCYLGFIAVVPSFSKSGPIPTTVSYNSSVVKIYSTTSSLVRFENIFFLLLWKTLYPSTYNADVVVVNLKVVLSGKTVYLFVARCC